MAISKEILTQYMDLKKEVVELKEKIQKIDRQIEQIEQEGAVIDKVMGGEGGLQPFKIEGFPYPRYEYKKAMLNARKSVLTDLENEVDETLIEVEKFISEVNDSHIRRIITFRVVDGLTWNEVASRMGGYNTEDTVKKTFYRFLEK